MLFSSFSAPLLPPIAVSCHESSKICSALLTRTYNDNNKTTTTCFLDNRLFFLLART